MGKVKQPNPKKYGREPGGRYMGRNNGPVLLSRCCVHLIKL